MRHCVRSFGILEPPNGYGPRRLRVPRVRRASIRSPTSLSRIRRPPRNWIDQTQARSRCEEHRLFAMPSRRRADAQGRAKCRARLHRLSRRKSGARPDERAGAHSAAEQGVLENLGQSAELKRLAQSRIAGIHPVHESRAICAWRKQACGLCHGEIIRNVDHSMMNHGAMLWGAALYNNGAYPAEELSVRPGLRRGWRAASPRSITRRSRLKTRSVHGILPFIEPLPRFNLSNPGNILRIFEKGGEKQLQLGLPTSEEPPGKPRTSLVRARSRHAQSHRSRFFSACKKRDCTIRCSAFSARTIIRAIIDPAVARPATSFMRTIVRRRIPAGGASTAIKV